MRMLEEQQLGCVRELYALLSQYDKHVWGADEASPEVDDTADNIDVDGNLNR